jgi:hypothetical protein
VFADPALPLMVDIGCGNLNFIDNWYIYFVLCICSWLLDLAYMLLIGIGIGLDTIYVEVDNLHDLLLSLNFTLSVLLNQNIL